MAAHGGTSRRRRGGRRTVTAHRATSRTTVRRAGKMPQMKKFKIT